MTLPFVQETRATIRKRVGKLTKRGFQGTATAGSTTTATLELVKKYPDNYFVGKNLYVVSGTGSGQEARVTASVQSTGVVTFSPTLATALDSTSVIEIWDENTTPDDVNDAINLAILDAQKITLVEVRSAPSAVASDGIKVTLPASMVYVTTLFAERSTANTFDQYKAVESIAYLTEYPYAFSLKGGYAYCNPALSAAQIAGYATLLEFTGYRRPALMATDSDLAEVSSDFLVYMASFFLESGDAEGPLLDPEQYAGRAGNWAKLAMTQKASMYTTIDPDTVRVGA